MQFLFFCYNIKRHTLRGPGVFPPGDQTFGLNGPAAGAAGRKEEMTMKIRDFLEKDRERLMNRLATADTADKAINVCEEELSRILLQYNEEVQSERKSEVAAYSLQTARAALPLVDSTGEIKVYERTLSSGKIPGAKRWMIPFGAGGAATVVGALLLALAPHAALPVAIIFLAGGCVASFIGGSQVGGRRGGTPAKKEQLLEAKLDNNKIYHNLATVLTVVDQNLEEAALKDDAENTVRLPDHNDLNIPKDELKLLADLLENAYSVPDPSVNADLVSEIRFYLHNKQIEVVDYTEENAKWFSKMPSKKNGTLRPALVQNGIVIMKGLAASEM